MLIPIVTDRILLRNKCEEVSREEGTKIGNLLVEQLKLHGKNAVGLAAPQIGINAKVFAMKYREETKFFVNPVILTQEKVVLSGEGCLSLPNEIIEVFRHEKISYTSEFNEGVLEDFSAIIFAHETDHLNGILMVDREVKPYNLCYCGSGKKFKFCHKGR